GVIGDDIVTRRNLRKLVTSNGGWVTNGDVWTITEIRPGGAVVTDMLTIPPWSSQAGIWNGSVTSPTPSPPIGHRA
ncbi:MAG TPA: hypothetical protein VE569_11340, partial [Acidimicrobiia bacterium]|nr:hypothetical protein [Acidimicrobiia bacterium]